MVSVGHLDAQLKSKSHHTLDLGVYLDYVGAWITNARLLGDHYKQSEYRLMKLQAKIGRQRFLSRYVNRMKEICGPPELCIVGIGSWSFSASIGNSPQRMLWEALSTAGFNVYSVDEAYTSRRCSGCQSQSAECHNFRLCDSGSSRFGLRWGLTQCDSCLALFNRDSVGSSNIRIAATYAAHGKARPAYLSSPTKVSTVGINNTPLMVQE
jgi:transposase